MSVRLGLPCSLVGLHKPLARAGTSPGHVSKSSDISLIIMLFNGVDNDIYIINTYIILIYIYNINTYIYLYVYIYITGSCKN